MTNMQVTESISIKVFIHICHWLWSMTNMQATESKSNSMFNAYLSMTTVNDTNALRLFIICTRLRAVNDKYAFSQWQICRLLSLNHTKFLCIYVIDYGQWQKSFETFIICTRLRPVNDKYAFSQWQICSVIKSKSHSVFMHICHWL